MSGYRVLGLDQTIANQVWAAGRDAFGDPVETFAEEDDRKPCRHCLEDIGAEREVLLLAHRPAARPGPYSEVGPIFLCRDACTPFDVANRLPPILHRRRLVVRGTTAEERINYDSSEIVDSAEAVEAAIRRQLADPRNAYLQIRTALYGCFLCKVVRV